MHRVITSAPSNKVVDHINGNTLDNRISNLRIVTNRENLQNQQQTHRSIYPGVTHENRLNAWRAKIKINNRRIEIGTFSSEIDAFKAYMTTCKESNIPIDILIEKFGILPEPLEVLKARRNRMAQVPKCKECDCLMEVPFRSNDCQSFCQNNIFTEPLRIRRNGFSPKWCPLRGDI